jgi:regulator of sigma E protease
MYKLEPVVGSVQKGMPAEKSGLIKDDRITAVDGVPINTWDDMASAISKSTGKTINISVLRKESKINAKITPVLKTDQNLFGETIKRYVIGITASNDHVLSVRLNPFEAFYQSLAQTYRVSEMMIIGIFKLFKGDISVKTLGGPIMIAQIAGDQAKQGASNLIYFIAFISINLAIVNFVPIPVLDGGHLMFFFIEAVFRKPVSIRFREIAQQAGIVALILLTILVFYNDLVRIFFNN